MGDDFSFGPFRFDAARLLLSQDGAAVPLGHRGGLLLLRLLEGAGAVVGKAELMQAGWGDAAVEESNLSVQIAKLRRALGPHCEIRAVERVGYQLLLPQAQGAARYAPRLHLNVTPGKAGDEVLDALIEAFQPFNTVTLLSGADAPHEGAYRLDVTVAGRGGARLQVAARLCNTSTRAYVWGRLAGPVTTSGNGLAGAAGRIAAEVTTALSNLDSERAELEHAPRSAFALSLVARNRARVLSPEASAEAIALFDRALELDPDDERILAAACEAYYHRFAMGWPALTPVDAERCAELAWRGLSSARYDAECLALFGGAIYRTQDRELGLQLVCEAAERNPNSLTALIYAGTGLMQWGDLDAAETMFQRATRLRPDDREQTFVRGSLARLRMIAGRFDEALAWARGALAANPFYGAAHWTLIAASAQLGDDGAERHIARFRRLQPAVTLASIQSAQPTLPDRMSSTLEGLERAGLN